MSVTGKTCAAIAALAFFLAVGAPGAPAPEAFGQNVRTLSAGVGKENRGAHPDFSLKLTFAKQSGAYLAGVRVRITDVNGGTVLDSHAAGPLLFVDLPRGTFEVIASRGGGREAAAKVTIIGGRQKKVYLTWK
ncbi:MAG: hypothetical protein V3S29_08690 [bacterium]